MWRFVPVALALVLTAVACDNGNSSTSASPTSPSVTLTPETFTGTVDVMGSDFHNFTAAQSGEVNVTLNAAGPPPTIFMGLGVGTPTGSACALFSSGFTNTQAGATPQLSGSVSAGTYCVEVYDIGNQGAPITYTVTVLHP